MNKKTYRMISLFHAALGDLPDPEKDYITKDTIFDLEICLENTDEVQIL